MYPYTHISFRNRITNTLLASCNACRMWLRKQFFTDKKDGSIPNIKKQNRRTDKYDRLGWFPSLSLVRLLLLLHEENKSGWRELRYGYVYQKKIEQRSFTSNFTCVSTSSSQNIYFFLNYFTTFFTKNKVYNIEKTFSLHKQLHPL